MNRLWLVLTLTLSAFAFYFISAPVAYGHGGRTNAQGCHNQRATGTYHCHGSGSTPVPVRAAPRAMASPRLYANCDAVRAAGAAPIRTGDSGYGSHLDRDGDGVGCEGSSSSSAGSSNAVRSLPSAATIFTSGLGEKADLSAYNLKGLLVGTVVVTDGDTIVLEGRRVRLFGIDAFEAEQTCGTYRCGGEATEYLRELTQSKTVICSQRDTDAYNRVVSVCRVDDRDLGALLVRKGLALAYIKYANDYVPDEAVARTEKIGVWNGEFAAPWDFRVGATSTVAAAQRNSSGGACVIKGNINSSGDRIYHLPGVSGYQMVRAEAMFCTIQEAEAAGFRARR